MTGHRPPMTAPHRREAAGPAGIPVDLSAQEILPDAGGDPRGRLVHEVARQVRVSGGLLHSGVAEKPGDHRQAHAEDQCAAGPTVTQVVKLFEAGVKLAAITRELRLSRALLRLLLHCLTASHCARSRS